jgi:flavodoxin
MNVWIIYESRLGNTAQLAMVIAQALARSERVQVLAAGKAGVPRGVELLLIGIPSHRHRSPDSVLEWLRRLPAGGLAGVHVSVFDIRYQPLRWFESSVAHKIGRKMLRLGAAYATLPESFFLTGHEGPLPEEEVQRARSWAQNMLRGFADRFKQQHA